jgi:uncharacterized protein YukE
MAMNYNTAALGNLSQNFTDDASTFDGLMTEIFASIEAMGTNWKGTVYNQFKTKMETFRDGSFAEIKSELDAWGAKFGDARDKSSTLTENLISQW